MAMTHVTAAEPLQSGHPERFRTHLRRVRAALRESPIGMIGAFLVLFWVVLAISRRRRCRSAIRWRSRGPIC